MRWSLLVGIHICLREVLHWAVVGCQELADLLSAAHAQWNLRGVLLPASKVAPHSLVVRLAIQLSSSPSAPPIPAAGRPGCSFVIGRSHMMLFVMLLTGSLMLRVFKMKLLAGYYRFRSSLLQILNLRPDIYEAPG